MLSVLCFICQLLEWTGSTLALTGVLASDNTGLLDRVGEQAKIRYTVPNRTFQPDFDVVEAIVQAMTEANLCMTFEHVKGHQDDSVSYDDLPLLAQMNVEADRYAGTYRTLSLIHI